jgi:spore coat protein A
MVSKNRRDFLKLCAASLPTLALVGRLDGEAAASPAVARPAYRTPASIDRYIDPLPIPKRLHPVSETKANAEYRVRMLEFERQMHSQLPPTKLWGYEGQYPGPMIEARQGVTTVVHWENRLPSQHIFKVDPMMHGAMPPAPAVRTVPHLHGSRTRSESDGLPEKWFASGKSERYEYPNNQAAATLWYHDHAVGITRLNVYAGLSGFYLLRDEHELSLNLPAGDYEIPLLLQDRTLDDKGQLLYSASHEDGQLLAPGCWGPMFYGELPVVNGSIYPYLEVEPRPYRLRVLNGANSRFFNLAFNLAKSPTDIPALITFHQIGTDGGFLPKPAAQNKLLMAPAERADLIVDFSGHEGKTVTLSNNAPAPFPGWDLGTASRPSLYELMQFRVTRPLSATGKAFSLPAPVPFDKLDEKASVATRDFILSEKLDDKGQSLGVRINAKGYDEPVTEFVKLGSVEKWRFINTTDDAHPMHLHLVQFQILHRQGYNIAAFFLDAKDEPAGTRRPPAANEAGWKDTAIVNPRDVLTVITRFEGYTGRYVFHCHMLEHEDNDMMRPYEVVADEEKSQKA